MNIRSEQLIQLSQNIVEELAIPKIRYATIGGSVARGEANQYSDIDLNIYVSRGPTYDDIFVCEGETIQLFVTDELPSEQQIKDNPWESRFLRESVSIYDPTREFCILKEYATTFFKSKEGKELLAKQAIDIVSIRKKSAMDSLSQGRFYSAQLGAKSSWADAAFMYLFFAHNTVSTGSLIPHIKKNIKNNYDEYTKILPFSLDLLKDGIGKVLRIVERHRGFLRLQYPSLSQGFSLSPLQDVLIQRKAQRLFHSGEYENMLWQLSGEVFMLFLEFSEGISFEEYYKSLPKNLQDDLLNIGFKGLDEEQVLKMCQLSDELVDVAIKFIGEESI